MNCKLSTTFIILIIWTLLWGCNSKKRYIGLHVHKSSKKKYIGLQVHRYLKESGLTNIIVVLREKDHVKRKLEAMRTTHRHLLPELLKGAADENQNDFLTFVNETIPDIGRVKSYWIANYVCIDGVTTEMLPKIARHHDVVSIHTNMPGNATSNLLPVDANKKRNYFDKVRNDHDANNNRERELFSQSARRNQKTTTLPLHLNMTRAYKLWEKGYHGQEVVVGVFSSGANVDHEALKPNYRGTLPDGQFDHNYNWYEGFPTIIPEPNDAINIGTHITGTILGSTNKIGQAPKAKFISCKGVDNLGRDAPEYHLKCYQFFLAPVDLNGTNSKSDLRPHIVNIQYCDSCVDDYLLVRPIQMLIEAGIFVTSPSGQGFEGAPKCLRINRPPANYKEVLTISGLSSDRKTLEISATGPPVFNGTAINNYTKPDIVTIGELVNSSVFLDNESYYFPATGSSAAGAVATGAVACLMSAIPAMKWNVTLAMEIIRAGSNRMDSLACDKKIRYPNSEFGYGSIDVWKSYQYAITGRKNTCKAGRCGHFSVLKRFVGNFIERFRKWICPKCE